MNLPATITAGVYLNIEDADYRKAPGVSNSMLKVLRSRWSPEYTKQRLAKPKPPSDAMAFGKALHGSLLTPEVKPTFVVLPADAPKYPTKAQINAKVPSPETVAAIKWWKDFETANAGLDVLQPHGNYGGRRLECTLNKFRSHRMAMAAIGEGHAEVSVFAPFNLGGSVMRKMRADWVCAGPTIVDLKTAMDCSPKCAGKRDEFSAQLYDLDYDMQAAYYLDTYNAAKPDDRKDNFVFVAMDWDEDTEFVGIRVGNSDEALLKSGREKYVEALTKWIECDRDGKWGEGYDPEVTSLSIPEFAAKKFRSIQLV